MNKTALVEFGMYTRKVGLLQGKSKCINNRKFANLIKIKNWSKYIPQSSIILFPPIQTNKQDRPTSCPAPRGVTVIDDIFPREIYFFRKMFFRKFRSAKFKVCFCLQKYLSWIRLRAQLRAGVVPDRSFSNCWEVNFFAKFEKLSLHNVRFWTFTTSSCKKWFSA